MRIISLRVAGGLLVAAVTLVLAACGSSASKPGSSAMGSMSMPGGPTSASASAAASHNQADVSFATDMIPHHGQAIEMADMALTQASSRQVKQLASQIKAAQGPEISTMSGWLKDWGAPVPSAPMSGTSMGGMSMNGMMSADEMKQLSGATGAALDKLWLQMMIKHHQGAIAMAKTELASGQYPQAKVLAQSISDSQATEITTMQGLLNQLS
jgi:uncharacterized protein (DUF305 family)